MALFRFFNQIIAPFRAKKVKEWCEVSSSLKPPAKVTGAWSSLLLRLSEMAWAEKVAYADCTGSLLVRIKYDQFRTSPNQINYLQSRSWRYIFQKKCQEVGRRNHHRKFRADEITSTWTVASRPNQLRIFILSNVSRSFLRVPFPQDPSGRLSEVVWTG